MNLYRITQNVNSGYDTYSDAIVMAKDAEQARQTHPGGDIDWDAERGEWYTEYGGEKHYETFGGAWAPPSSVNVELIGAANPRFVTMQRGNNRIICASFHAG